MSDDLRKTLIDSMNVCLFLIRNHQGLSMADIDNMSLLDFDYYYNKTLRDIEDMRNKNKNKMGDSSRTPFTMAGVNG